MTANFTERIAVVVMLGDVARSIMLLVKEGPSCDRLGGDGADPADCIDLGV
jgi:hypothetical protein